MINSFKQYLIEEEGAVYFNFGRMNPPTIGHGKLLDKLAASSGRNPYRIYVSQSYDSKKNPLDYQSKVKHVRKMFPKHARQVMLNKKVKTALDAATALHAEGFTKLVMVVGDDRVREFDILLNKYNGKKSRHGFYNFSSIKVVNAGQRDPDAEGAEGASATKQRQAAKNNDFTSFSQGLPKTVSNANAKKLFNDVRKGMGLKEQKEFKNHVQLKPVSQLREAYVKKNLFDLGEQVVMSKNDKIGTIQHLGANYVIVESNNETYRCWISDVSKINEEYKYEWGTDASAKHARKMTPGQNEGKGLWANIHAKRARGERMRKKGEKGAPTPDQIKRAQEDMSTRQDPDIADRKGSQPARYFTGLSKATKIARDRHFKAKKKGPAPGDANAKTKPSVNTKFVRNLMGVNENYNNWINQEPVAYAKHLTKTFGQPDEMTDSQLCWFAKDGFKRIVVKDEHILHGSPAPHYDFIYCYIDLKVPEKFATALAESSGSIMVDYLKGEVGARCGSLTANATTLNYCLDVVAGRVRPSKKEYEKRILGMKKLFSNGKKYELDWWPDESNDADPNNKYYAEGHSAVCGCLIHEKVNVKRVRAMIKKDKEKEKKNDRQDAIKHDAAMDRARMADTRKKNRETNPMQANEDSKTSFAAKSKKSGISVATLKKVYARGVAAHRTGGHRPGTSPEQWGHGRVNAFIRKKKQGGLNHDKDLA